jgi:hypothetical protein
MISGFLLLGLAIAETNTSLNETVNDTVNVTINETIVNETDLNTTEDNLETDGDLNESTEVNETVTETVTTTTFETTSDTASITIKDWYPQIGAYVFECNTPGFTPTSYDWFYGDGEKLLDSPHQNVFHTYLQNGDYDVTCVARSGDRTAEATLRVSVNDIPFVNACSPLQNTPATCEGGTVTQQELGESCRTIICEGDGNRLSVLACDKPSADNPLYFDMYKKSETGGGLQVCISGTCIGENGFARSPIMACQAGNDTEPVSDVIPIETPNGTELEGIHVMTHLCDADMTREELQDMNSTEREIACPTTLPFGETFEGINAGNTAFEIILTDVNNTEYDLNDATLMRESICEPELGIDIDDNGTLNNETCLDTSHYRFTGIYGDVEVIEIPAPNTTFGAAEVISTSDVVGVENGVVLLDISEGDYAMVHLYNFREIIVNDTNGTNETNQTGNETNQTGNAEFGTLVIMKHVCGADVNSVNDFDALGDFSDKLAACPVTVLPGDTPSGAVGADASDFAFSVYDLTDTPKAIADAVFVQNQLCEDDLATDVDGDGTIEQDACFDASSYRFDNVMRGNVIVVETAASGTRFGDIEFTPAVLGVNNDEETVMLITDGTVQLDTSLDDDSTTVLHVFNFVE